MPDRIQCISCACPALLFLPIITPCEILFKGKFYGGLRFTRRTWASSALPPFAPRHAGEGIAAEASRNILAVCKLSKNPIDK